MDRKAWVRVMRMGLKPEQTVIRVSTERLRMVTLGEPHKQRGVGKLKTWIEDERKVRVEGLLVAECGGRYQTGFGFDDGDNGRGPN
jgi:hypothetical protein